MQYYFEACYNKRKRKSYSPGDFVGKRSLHQVRQDRFQMKDNVYTLQNRVGQLLMQQEKTKLKLAQQSEQTLQILKNKFKNEQNKLRKTMKKQKDEVELATRRHQNTQTKLSLKQSIQDSKSKMKQSKKDNRNYLHSESKIIETEMQYIKQKGQLEKLYMKNTIKDGKMKGKQRISRNECVREMMINQQVNNKKYQEGLLRQLEQKEKQIMENIRNTQNQQVQQKDVIKQAQSLSTQQFRSQFPDYYQQVESEIHDTFATTFVNQTEDTRIAFRGTKNRFTKIGDISQVDSIHNID